jgi:enoyl-CoA hydratase/carnithine racemase
VLDLKEVIDSARINFQTETQQKRSRSSLASSAPTTANQSSKSQASPKSNSAPASPVKAAAIVDSSTTTSSKRRAPPPPSSSSSLGGGRSFGLIPKRQKTDKSSKNDYGSSSSEASVTCTPSASAAPSASASAAPSSSAAATPAQPTKTGSNLLTEVKRRKAEGKGWSEVMKLHMDEGVYHLLHSLPTSRRKTQTAHFSVAAGSPGGGASASPTSLIATVKPNNRHNSPVPAQSQSLIGGAHKSSSYYQRRPQPNKNHLIRVNRTNVKGTTPDALMTPKTLELLKKLPKKDYVDLWSSTSRYKLTDEAMTAAAACSLPQSNKASSISPDSSASSDISSASALAAAARKRHRIGDRMLTCVTNINKQYKDIFIRSYPNFSQIIMCPSTTGLKHSINVNVLEEMTDAMRLLADDATCRAVLVTGLGPIFCQGVDLSVLTYDSVEKQKKSAESLAKAIKNFVKFLLGFPKLLIAAVNGSCSGLGLTLLPFFDIVYASDKAVLRADYPRLGQIPEAFASVTFSQSAAALSEVLLLGRSVTASEANRHGLVSSVIWPDRFLEEIVPRIELLDSVNPVGMQMTKALLKERLKRQVTEVMEEETKKLIECWTGPNYSKNIRQYLKSPNQIIFQ